MARERMAMQPAEPANAGLSRVAHQVSDNMLLLMIGGGVVVFHLLTNGQYGFHRDELDILMNARQLDWGYVAYPPITPLIARAGLELFGTSLVGLRSFAAIAQGIVVILAGMMARDFGGARAAQITAALAAAISPVALTSGTLIQYMSFDFLWWVLLSFFVVRLLRTEDPRWWLGIGMAVGLGMMTKYTMAFFAAGLVAGVLITATRRYLKSPWLWAGVAVAMIIFLPNFLWQVRNDFVSLDFLSAIHTRDISWGRTDAFLLEQLHVAANPLTIPLWLAGLYFLLLAPAGKRFRPLAWMFLVTFVLLWLSRGRAYYVGPAYTILLAAGAVWLEAWLRTRQPRTARWSWAIVAVALALGAAMAVVFTKPVAPINSSLWRISSEVNGDVKEMVGWPDLARQVSEIYQALPSADQGTTAILAGNYGEAGAFDLYRADFELPPVISAVNSLHARGYGVPPPETLIAVGFDAAQIRSYFSSCQPAGRVQNRYGVRNEEATHHNTMFVCREPRRPWPELWVRLQQFQ